MSAYNSCLDETKLESYTVGYCNIGEIELGLEHEQQNILNCNDC